MSVSRHFDEEHDEVVISIDGRFDFALHKLFRDAYRDIEPGKGFRVDLSRATYLDSSALGMLLLLREHAGGEQAHVCISGCGEDVLRVLRIANFNRLFTIE